MVALKRALPGTLLALTMAFGAGTAGAQDSAQGYPSKPVRLVVPNSPGTTVDNAARILAPELSKDLGQPVVVENRPGAGFVIGYEHVARSDPDGHTIAVAILQDMAILPLVNKALRFDTLKDLPAFIGLADGKLVFGTAAKNPWKTFDELVTHARQNPGKLNFGASGPQVRIPMEALVNRLDLKVVHVPYSGGAPYFQALAAGDVHMGFIGEATMLTLGDRFRPLAVTGDKPLEKFPEVPTFAQVGHPQLRSISMSLHLPAGTPAPIVTKLYTTTARIMERPEIQQRFASLRYPVSVLDPEAVARRLDEEAKAFAQIARQAGIEPK